MDKKTFELTFVVRYEVTEDDLANYSDEEGNPMDSFYEGLSIDLQCAEEMTKDFWEATINDGDEFTVTGRILEDS